MQNMCIGMPRLNIELPQQIEEELDDRMETTGQTKSEITRNALIKELGL